MAGYLKNQLSKQLSLYFKNITPDKFSLSFFKGEGRLQDLELQEDFLQSSLDMPEWLVLKQGKCHSVRAKVPWTNLKHAPVEIIIDRVDIELQVSEEIVALLSSGEYRPSPLTTSKKSSSADPKKEKEKYGYFDAVVDGIRVQVQVVNVKFSTADFDVTAVIEEIDLRSTTPKWEVADLTKTKIIDEKGDKVYVYREFMFRKFLLSILPRAPDDLAHHSSLDPLEFGIDEPRLRAIICKSYKDPSQTFSIQLQLVVTTLKLELTKYHIMTLQYFFETIKELARQNRILMVQKHALSSLQTPPPVPPPLQKTSSSSFFSSSSQKASPVPAPAASTMPLPPPVSTSFHMRINSCSLILREPRLKSLARARRAEKNYITTVIIHKIVLHFFSDQEFGASVETKDNSLKIFLEDKERWLKRLIPPNIGDVVNSQHVHQSLLVASLYNFQFSSDSGMRHENPAMRNVNLISSDHEKFHLSADTPLFQIAFTDYFPSLRYPRPSSTASSGPRGSSSSVPPPPPTMPYLHLSNILLPPPNVYTRIYPIVIEFHQAAIMKLIHFFKGCIIEEIVDDLIGDSPDTSSSSPSPRPGGPPAYPIFNADHATDPFVVDANKGFPPNMAPSSNTTQITTQVRPLSNHAVPMTSPLSPSTARVKGRSRAHERTHFYLEAILLSFKIPELYNVPDEMKRLFLHVTCSRVMVTNSPSSSQVPIRGSDLMPFYSSPLVAHNTLFANHQPDTSTSEESTSGFVVFDAIPPISLVTSSDSNAPDRENVLSILCEHVWGDFRKDDEKWQMFSPISLHVKLVNISKLKEPLPLHTKLADDYILVRVSGDVDFTLDHYQYLYLMRVFGEYDKNVFTLDTGAPLNKQVLFLTVEEANLKLVSHLDPTEAIFSTTLRNIDVLLQSEGRQSVRIVSVGSVKLHDEMVNSPTVSDRSSRDSLSKQKEVAILLKMVVSFPHPDQARAYYSALDRRALQKQRRISLEKEDKTHTIAPLYEYVNKMNLKQTSEPLTPAQEKTLTWSKRQLMLALGREDDLPVKNLSLSNDRLDDVDSASNYGFSLHDLHHPEDASHLKSRFNRSMSDLTTINELSQDFSSLISSYKKNPSISVIPGISNSRKSSISNLSIGSKDDSRSLKFNPSSLPDRQMLNESFERRPSTGSMPIPQISTPNTSLQGSPSSLSSDRKLDASFDAGRHNSQLTNESNAGFEDETLNPDSFIKINDSDHLPGFVEVEIGDITTSFPPPGSLMPPKEFLMGSKEDASSLADSESLLIDVTEYIPIPELPPQFIHGKVQHFKTTIKKSMTLRLQEFFQDYQTKKPTTVPAIHIEVRKSDIDVLDDVHMKESLLFNSPPSLAYAESLTSVKISSVDLRRRNDGSWEINNGDSHRVVGNEGSSSQIPTDSHDHALDTLKLELAMAKSKLAFAEESLMQTEMQNKLLNDKVKELSRDQVLLQRQVGRLQEQADKDKASKPKK